jgi:sulfate permease, SulP family
MVLDGPAIGDVDYTAAAVLTHVIEHLRKRHIRLAVNTILGPVREQLDRYGISAALGPSAYYGTRRGTQRLPRREKGHRRVNRARKPPR